MQEQVSVLALTGVPEVLQVSDISKPWFYGVTLPLATRGTAADQRLEGQTVFRPVSEDKLEERGTYMSFVSICTMLALKTRN